MMIDTAFAKYINHRPLTDGPGVSPIGGPGTNSAVLKSQSSPPHPFVPMSTPRPRRVPGAFLCQGMQPSPAPAKQ